MQSMKIELPAGVLVAVEGIDGAGKTTQARIVAERVRAVGLDVVLTKEPTDGPWGTKLRSSARTGRLSPEDELHAFIEDRREHVAQLLQPALDAGKVVIVDRYYLSTVAYQGARGRAPVDLLKMNEAFAPQPDLVVVLDVPPAVGLARIRSRGDRENLFEQEEALGRSAEIFRKLHLAGMLLLDGERPIAELTEAILTRLRRGPLFERLCPKARRVDGCLPAYCATRLANHCIWAHTGDLEPAPDPAWLDLAAEVVQDDRIPPEKKASAFLARTAV